MYLLEFVGGASLRAQEGSENGWFVSASPLIFGASKIETKTTITASGGGEVTVGDLTADIRTDFFNADTTNQAQNLARDLCAGTLVGVTGVTQGQSGPIEIVVLDNLEIVYLAEDRSDATDLTIGTGQTITSISFRLNGVEKQPLTEDPINDIVISHTNASPIADSGLQGRL